MKQLVLPLTAEERPRSSVTYHAIPAKQATFKAGLSARVHRWFRLTPSFGPDLVQEMLACMRCGGDEVVLDPFSGAGTTLIECQLENRSAYGVEINPLLHFVGTTCLNWRLDAATLRSELERVVARFNETAYRVTYSRLNDFGFVIPPIHNPTRWWREDVLTHLVILKNAIGQTDVDEAYSRFFRLALAGVLVPDLTNVTLGRLQLHFIDRTHDPIDVLSTFVKHASMMIGDLEAVQEAGLTTSAVIHYGDSTTISGDTFPRRVDCVVTSPPYPNRYSYVWNTRPHLYLLDFFSTPKQASDLDKITIGGTWGTATSLLAKGAVEPLNAAVERVVSPVVESIRIADNLMANYVMKYFNLLAEQILAMDGTLSESARVAYVVGCSRIKGVYVETDVLLGQIFESLGLGYGRTQVERIRKRNSGKDLHESIVYAWKG